jgi:hypothetical protein
LLNESAQTTAPGAVGAHIRSCRIKTILAPFWWPSAKTGFIGNMPPAGAGDFNGITGCKDSAPDGAEDASEPMAVANFGFSQPHVHVMESRWNSLELFHPQVQEIKEMI